MLPQLSAPCNVVIGPSRAYVIEPSQIGRRRGLALQAKGKQSRGTRRVYKLAPARHVDFLSSPLQLIIKSEGKVALSASSSASRSNHHHPPRSLSRNHDNPLARPERQINRIPTRHVQTFVRRDEGSRRQGEKGVEAFIPRRCQAEDARSVERGHNA